MSKVLEANGNEAFKLVWHGVMVDQAGGKGTNLKKSFKYGDGNIYFSMLCFLKQGCVRL